MGKRNWPRQGGKLSDRWSILLDLPEGVHAVQLDGPPFSKPVLHLTSTTLTERQFCAAFAQFAQEVKATKRKIYGEDRFPG